MSLVNAPLPPAEPARHARAALTVRAMEIGQHVIAVALTAIGAVRAVTDGVAVPAAVLAAAAILAWHTAGAVLPARTRSKRVIVGWLIGFAVVWGCAVAVSAEFVWVAFLLWLLAGHLLPMVWGVLFSAAVLAVVAIAPVLHDGATSWANVFGPLIGGVFAFGISRGYLQLLHDAAEREHLVASLTLAQQQTAALQDELVLAQRQAGAIAERTRISRDLHDTVAQSLSSIRLLAHAGLGRQPGAAQTLSRVETLAGESLADVRRIVAALAPAELEQGALTAALERMLDRARDESGLRAELHVDQTLPQLPTEVDVALLRLAQSALANVRQHAGAARVVLSLIDADDSVRLDVIDDGKGFDLAAWEGRDEAAASSFGLRFMRARLRELGGGLDIETAPGEGTALSAHLPLHMTPSRDAGAGPLPAVDPTREEKP